MSEIADLSATVLSSAFAAGMLSPVEALDAVLARVEALEPVLGATYALDAEGARRDAKASEARWRTDAALGALDGVPITVKELIATKGVPIPLGSAATELVPEPADAPVAQRLREQGAVIFCKTTAPDYGMLSSGLSSLHPLTRNPWNTDRNPGGSSSGAGAAAAAGYGPLHIGTDIGGSIRLPSNWCGVFGLKPSHGRVPLDRPYMGRVAGPMTRTVEDAGLLMTAIAQPDARDYMGLPPVQVPWLDLDVEVRGLRIGLMLDAGCGRPVEPEVIDAVSQAARVFEGAGAIVEPIQPFMTPELLQGFDQFFRMRSWVEIGGLPKERYEKILPIIRAWVEGAARYEPETSFIGFSKLMKIRELGVRASQRCDYVISPVAPIGSFAVELPSPNNDPEALFDHIGFTMPYNLTEQPASSINCGYTSDGMPIGLQIVGRRFDDIGVLRLSRWFEAHRPPQRPWPSL